MIRKLKILGLALVAVFAMSAVAASAASAATPGEFTSDGSVTVTGTSVAETFTFEAGQKTVCNVHHTIMPQNQTPWAPFNPGTGLTTLTIQSHYKECVVTVGATSIPATVTTNGCDFLVHIGETTTGSKYGGTTDIVCGAGEAIETHGYQNATHATSICTYKVPAQTGLKGAEVENVAGTLKVTGTLTGLTVSKTGIVCGGSKETKEALLHVNATISGTNAGGTATAIEITD